MTNGYFAFHDTSPHILPCTDYQKVGSKADPDSYISVRKALYEIGLFTADGVHGFELFLDEADPNNPAGGVTIFKRKH